MRRPNVFRLLVLLLSPATAVAGPGGDWYGELIYHFDAEYIEKRELNDCKSLKVFSDIRAARIRFCGRNATHVESRARYNLLETFERKCEEKLFTCRQGNQPHVVRPGNSRTEGYEKKALVNWVPFDQLEFGFSMPESDTAFHLTARGAQSARFVTEYKSARTDVCTGMTRSDLPDRQVVGKGKWAMSVILDKEIRGSGFSQGSEPLSKPAPPVPGGRTVEMVSWFVASPCGRIRYQFGNAIALVKKYKEELEKKPSSSQEYEEGIDTALGAKTEYGVANDDCSLWDAKEERVLTPEEFRSKVVDDYLCAPPVVHESIFQHEMTHQKQCIRLKGTTAFSKPTPEETYVSEKETYCVEAGILLSALEQCGGNQWEKRSFKSTCGGK